MSDEPANASPKRLADDTSWSVRCPCCETTLQIDRATGALMQSVPKRPAAKDFDALLADVDARRERAEQVFDQERAAHGDRQRLLDQRFEAALDAIDHSSDDDETPRPPHPLDL